MPPKAKPDTAAYQKLKKDIMEGTIQIPEFILFGDYGGTIYLWVDEGTGTVSVDFRQGRL